MYTRVTFHRSVMFKRPMGPWRFDRDQARRDAVDAKLGTFDERGNFYDIVPGAIEQIELPTLELIKAVEHATHGEVTRVSGARRSRGRSPAPAARPQTRSADAPGWRNKA
jgi:hypothetical protein